MEDKRCIVHTPLVRLESVRCRRALRGLSCEECKSEHLISIPLSGMNVRHVGGNAYTVSPSHATLSNRGEEYRISHPYGSGEVQLNLAIQEALLLEMLCTTDPAAQERALRPFRERQLPIGAHVQMAAHWLTDPARENLTTELEMESAAIDLADYLMRSTSNRMPLSDLTAREVELAEAARTYIAANFTAPLSLQGISAAVGTSVYHLSRIFRRATGFTLWLYVVKHRTAEALSRLAQNETDLSDLALELGYANHSHFTAGFRRGVGITPSAAQQLFRTGPATQVRTMLNKGVERL